MASSSTNGKNMIEFCKLLGCLKHLKRTGWVKRGIPEPETVACHMYRMAVLSLFLDQHLNLSDGDSATSTGKALVKLDTTKCMKMALAHDMAESIVGDITPHCGISAEEKFRREEEAMKKLSILAPSPIGEELLALWYEYEKQETPESRSVKDLDKFDMIMQAAEYEQSTDKAGSLQEFFDSTKGEFENPTVKGWVEALEQFRDTVKE